MNTHVKFLVVTAAIAVMFSSCKKTTDTSVLEAHKWVLNSEIETYSDSIGVSHNLTPADTVCQSSNYTEFHTNATNAVLKLAYTYSTTNCQGAIYMPSVGLSSWNIDPDNTVLYLNGSSTDGTGGTWYTIQTLNGSSMVLTIVFQNSIGNTGAPHFSPIYHTVTDTWNYTTK